MSWDFRIDDVEYFVREWHEAPEGAVRSGPRHLEVLAGHVASSGFARARLRALLSRAGIELRHAELAEHFRTAVERGQLVVWVRHVPVVVFHGGGGATESAATAAAAASSEPEPAPELDWVEIELVDEDDLPIQGARFELTLPDGSTRRTRTDDRGRFFVPSTDPGQCQLRWIEMPPVEQARRFAQALEEADEETAA